VTILADFLQEMLKDPEIDARIMAMSDKWNTITTLFAAIDTSTNSIELRKAMESVITRKGVSTQDRATALIPLLQPMLPGGGTKH